MFCTLTFIVAIGPLSTFKILFVMCKCYTEFKILPPCEVTGLDTREVS